MSGHRRVQIGALLFIGIVAVFASKTAHAQYRNTSWGTYAGVNFIYPGNNLDYYKEADAAAPSLSVVQNGKVLPKANPFSLINPMLSLELNFKVSLESWWLKTGLNVGLVSIVDDRAYNPDAYGGMSVGLEGMFGARYYFLTDNFRPYGEFGIRINGLLNTNPRIPTALKAMFGAYGAIGLEFIVARDIGITVLGRFSRFFILNFPGYFTTEGLAGVIFYI